MVWCQVEGRYWHGARLKLNRGVLSSQVAVVAIDCWYQEGMCRRSVQGLAFPVVYGHTAGQQILYPQGLREDELVGIYIYAPLHQHL